MSVIAAATAADLPACADLIARTPFFKPYFSRAQILQAMIQRPDTHILLLERFDPVSAVRGLCWFDPRGHLSRGGYLRLLAVDPAQQGRGVAGRLMDEAEEQVFAVASALFLMVAEENTPARHFYKRRGYSGAGLFPDYAAPGQTELLMYKCRPTAS